MGKVNINFSYTNQRSNFSGQTITTKSGERIASREIQQPSLLIWSKCHCSHKLIETLKY